MYVYKCVCVCVCVWMGVKEIVFCSVVYQATLEMFLAIGYGFGISLDLSSASLGFIMPWHSTLNGPCIFSATNVSQTHLVASPRETSFSDFCSKCRMRYVIGAGQWIFFILKFIIKILG